MYGFVGMINYERPLRRALFWSAAACCRFSSRKLASVPLRKARASSLIQSAGKPAHSTPDHRRDVRATFPGRRRAAPPINATTLHSELFYHRNMTANQNSIALSSDRGSLEIAGVSLLYEGTRVKSYLLGRDLNPMGRGDGALYAEGMFSAGNTRPRPNASPIGGFGNSINNFGIWGDDVYDPCDYLIRDEWYLQFICKCVTVEKACTSAEWEADPKRCCKRLTDRNYLCNPTCLNQDNYNKCFKMRCDPSSLCCEVSVTQVDWSTISRNNPDAHGTILNGTAWGCNSIISCNIYCTKTIRSLSAPRKCSDFDNFSNVVLKGWKGKKYIGVWCTDWHGDCMTYPMIVGFDSACRDTFGGADAYIHAHNPGLFSSIIRCG